ncbi:tRNA pseudouridine(55) synthase TruB [Mesomycoplasma hyorhinis]|uniref:tRNA pseudouridine synthase B n=1 Tax=Mesomycoplasma hyorhinis (strain MCLD) TaxID=936139 RepID=A0ABM5M692_MESHM|nr:tRNA pseudouridine(55) synthase TruB [Mesomycoplasma hyorhinis]AEC46166.1 tRNA pseudouridine synthase B [Mesomycoplasma hyorhinis MCLD]AEX14319.1 tRNA pseudouridine synthase B [Mesomycoplasma hyorhinis GDL-1]AHA41329.1 tRNA pseudouridine(55) synthase [Mesomycoplasma hyorhinis DBS 1050]TRM84239.1 tRNA pseudouridine(55) synthase TruB [Sulfolobus sp. A20-N-F6]CRH24598.1 tRNA pseudouridine synthase B [Chlamydia trachomatis]
MIKLLYKPTNITSFKFIKNYARENNITKIGHTGTLDPLASGLMLIATDEDTKFIPYIDTQDKEYIVKLKFGFISDTYDIEGEIEEFSQNKVTLKQIEEQLKILVAKEEQLPPVFSAKKVNGQRSYDLARQNKFLDLKPIKIKVLEYNILNFDHSQQTLELQFRVSRGTYIRTLVHDLGQMLKIGAIMVELTRTKINFLDFSFLNQDLNVLDLIHLSQTKIDKFQLQQLMQGKVVSFEQNYKDQEETLLVFLNQAVGIATIKNKFLKSTKLFGNKIKIILNEQGNKNDK